MPTGHGPYSINSTFDSTLTDRPAVKVKVALPLRAHVQNRPDERFPCNALTRRLIINNYP